MSSGKFSLLRITRACMRGDLVRLAFPMSAPSSTRGPGYRITIIDTLDIAPSCPKYQPLTKLWANRSCPVAPLHGRNLCAAWSVVQACRGFKGHRAEGEDVRITNSDSVLLTNVPRGSTDSWSNAHWHPRGLCVLLFKKPHAGDSYMPLIWRVHRTD
jgi:hypothetical protein